MIDLQTLSSKEYSLASPRFKEDWNLKDETFKEMSHHLPRDLSFASIKRYPFQDEAL